MSFFKMYILQNGFQTSQANSLTTNLKLKHYAGAAPVAQRFSATCSPGRDPGDPGSSQAPCMVPASPSACVSASLSLSFSLSLCVSL